MPTVLERIRKGAFPHLQQAPKLSARTINEKYLAFVQVVFSYAVNNGLVEVNPCTGVRAASNTTELEDVSVLPFSKEDLSVIFQRSGLYHPHGCGAVGGSMPARPSSLTTGGSSCWPCTRVPA